LEIVKSFVNPDLLNTSVFINNENVLNLNHNDNHFDIIISIATIHHLDSRASRLNAMKEMYRVLNKGGIMLIYVMSFENKIKYESTDEVVPFTWYTKVDGKKKAVEHKLNR